MLYHAWDSNVKIERSCFELDMHSTCTIASKKHINGVHRELVSWDEASWKTNLVDRF
jgi:hypothetical protein